MAEDTFSRVETSRAVFEHDGEKCQGCGACMEACPNDAILVSVGYLEVDESSCVACGKCAQACPTGALRMTPKG